MVVIFGGSGFLGRHVAQRLARLGYAIRIGIRRPNNALFLKPMGRVGQIELIAADIRHTKACARLMEGVDAVVNLVGILRESGEQRFDEIHGHAPGRLAEQAASMGVSSFVQISALGSDEKSPAHYGRSKSLGEKLVQKAIPEAIILRPSIIFGPEDDFFNRFAAMAMLSPFLPLFGGGTTRFQPIFVGDVAEAIVLSLEQDSSKGKVFELGGAEVLSFHELLKLLLEIIERRRLLLPIPFPLAVVLAACIGWLPNAPFTLDQLRMLHSDSVVTPDAVCQNRDCQFFGIDPYPLGAVLPSYLARFRQSGEFSRDGIRHHGK